MLQTDTLDVRYTPHGERSRAWLGARIEGGAAGLFITPWSDGAPDPTRALIASYAGVDGAYLAYGPGGLYGGARASARVWLFAAREETTVPVPGPTLQAEGDLILGWWTPTLHAWSQFGLVDTEMGVSPRSSGELTYHPSAPVTPFLEARAGFAAASDDLSRTRLGGLVPYVVPVAGAAWAEWWVEDYGALRIGGEAKTTLGQVTLRTSTFADAATFDDADAMGFGAALGARWGRAFVDSSVGYAPWIPREPGISRVSVYALAGVDWGAGRIGP